MSNFIIFTRIFVKNVVFVIKKIDDFKRIVFGLSTFAFCLINNARKQFLNMYLNNNKYLKKYKIGNYFYFKRRHFLLVFCFFFIQHSLQKRRHHLNPHELFTCVSLISMSSISFVYFHANRVTPCVY